MVENKICVSEISVQRNALGWFDLWEMVFWGPLNEVFYTQRGHF